MRPGQRVMGIWGNKCTIVEINRAAEHGFGTISVRFDDGCVNTYALTAHGLEPIWLGTLRQLWWELSTWWRLRTRDAHHAGVYFNDNTVCIHAERVWAKGPRVQSEPYVVLPRSQMAEVARRLAETLPQPRRG